MDVLTEDYINPFQVKMYKLRLVRLNSGVPAPDDVAQSLLSIEKMGAKQHKEFLEKQIQSSTSFHQPFIRNKVLEFKSVVNNISLKNGKKSVEVNNDILAKLFSISLKEDKQIDFEKALNAHY